MIVGIDSISIHSIRDRYEISTIIAKVIFILFSSAVNFLYIYNVDEYSILTHVCRCKTGKEVLDDEDHDCFSNNHTCQHPAVEEKCQEFSEVSKGKELRLYSIREFECDILTSMKKNSNRGLDTYID